MRRPSQKPRSVRVAPSRPVSEHAHRTALGACLALAFAGLIGCQFYKSELLDPDANGGNSGGASGSASGTGGGGNGGTGPCVPAPESCNAIDDDCDGQIDNGASQACSNVILNADSSCVPFE